MSFGASHWHYLSVQGAACTPGMQERQLSCPLPEKLGALPASVQSPCIPFLPLVTCHGTIIVNRRKMATKQTVSPDEIQKIARLAKLHLDDEKRDLYTQQINAILEHVQKLGTLDVAGVEPLSHVLDLVNVTRKDEPDASLPRDIVLANAPLTEKGSPDKRATDGEFFLVPKIIKTEE